MEKIFITAPASNTGKATLNAILTLQQPVKLVLGNRKPLLMENTSLVEIENRHFDYTNTDSYTALEGCSTLLLIRPPEITAINTVFKPLIEAAKKYGISYIVFISVQGADTNRFIPQSKIERVIIKSEIDFCFLRPAYFMQNFLTTLNTDIREKQTIFLPAGNATFALIDTEDVGAVAASIILNKGQFKQQAYDLTCYDRLTFTQMAATITTYINKTIHFKSLSPYSFYRMKSKEGMPRTLIIVMILLHFLPRFKKKPSISNAVKEIIHRDPVSFTEFVQRHRQELL